MGHPPFLLIPARELVGECEDYVDGGFHFYGLVVEEVGAVAPLADGVEGGLLEDGGAAEDAEIGDGAVFGDGGGEDYCALDVHGLGEGWVVGDDLANEEAGGDAGGDADGSLRFWGDDAGRWGG